MSDNRRFLVCDKRSLLANKLASGEKTEGLRHNIVIGHYVQTRCS